MVSGVPQESVLGPLLFITCLHDMWSGLESDIVAYADDATLIAVVPSLDVRAAIADSLNCGLAKGSVWYTLWGYEAEPH